LRAESSLETVTFALRITLSPFPLSATWCNIRIRIRESRESSNSLQSTIIKLPTQPSTSSSCYKRDPISNGTSDLKLCTIPWTSLGWVSACKILIRTPDSSHVVVPSGRFYWEIEKGSVPGRN
jgi:hypothetical protein